MVMGDEVANGIDVVFKLFGESQVLSDQS